MDPAPNTNPSASIPTPTPTPTTPPISPVVPPQPVIQSPTNNNPTPGMENPPNFFNKRNIIIISGAVLLLIVVLLFIFYLLRPKSTGIGTNLLDILPEDLSKYSVDTDTDGYPDFIETEVGLNPQVSEYTSCKKGDCSDPNLQQTNTKHNVLIILDASGSMNTGNPSRMDIAKQAIKDYVTKAASGTNIGLMVYGHKGSNSVSDKSLSCSSAEVISPIGQFNSASVDGVLNPIVPVGWTPIGLAIQQASQAFSGKNGENNEIIILTDGEETCDTNPTQRAAELKSSALNVTINVIGFAVNAAAQSQLNQISTSGGGSFTTASNLTELDQKFNDLYENGLKLLQNLKCNTANADAFRTCYNSSFQKVMDWIQKRKLMLYDKKISQNEYNKLEDLSTKLYKQQNDVTTSETQNAVDQYKNKSNQP